MKKLHYFETSQVSGGLDGRQITTLVTMGMTAFGDVVSNAVLSQAGIPQDKFSTKFMVAPAVKILFTSLGFEVGNYLTEGED